MPYKLNKTCPVCGVRVDDRAKYCGKHRAFDRAQPSGYICPICGGAKSRIESKVCSNCYDPTTNNPGKPGWERKKITTASINPESLTPEWLYQFVGVFYSEGCVELHMSNHKTINSRLTIGLRPDDEKALRDIQSKLGGIVHTVPRKKGSFTYWHVSRIHEVKTICELLLQYTLIPLKKSHEVEIVLRFINWRLQQPLQRVPDWTFAENLLQELRSIRVFKLHS